MGSKGRQLSKSGVDYVPVVIASILVVGATIFLSMREGRHVSRLAALDEVQGNLVVLEDATVDSAHEGSLVRIVGDAQTDESLRDPDAAIEVNALSLTRSVLMYQWEETRHTTRTRTAGGHTRTRTDYRYNTKWSAEYYDSSTFHSQEGHENPPLPLGPLDVRAQTIAFGQFVLDERFATPVEGSVPLAIDPAVAHHLAERLDEVASPDGESAVYVGSDIENPQVGDLYIEYSHVPSPTPVTVIGRQSGNTIESYTTDNGNEILLVYAGRRAPEEMIEAERSANAALVWLGRIGSGIVVLVGLLVFVSANTRTGKPVPGVGRWVVAAPGLFVSCATIAIPAFALALQWIGYSLLVGGAMLAVGGVSAGVFIARSGSRQRTG